MNQEIKEAIVFTDGSSRGNPGKGGWGAIIMWRVDDGEFSAGKAGWKVEEIGGSSPKTTNNRMEITAVLEAFVFLKQKNIKSAVIYTDSSYVAKGMQSWVYSWQSNGWKTKSGDSVLNQDLWEKMLAFSQIIDASFELVSGHSGVSGNERCDEIATACADGFDPHLFSGLKKDYKYDLSIKKIDSSVNNFGSSNSKNKKAYSYISEVDGVVKIHSTWAECEGRVKGKKARFKKALSRMDEENIFREFSKK